MCDNDNELNDDYRYAEDDMDYWHSITDLMNDKELEQFRKDLKWYRK